MGPTPSFAAGRSFGKVHSLGPFLGTGTLHLLPVMSTPTSDPSTAGWPLGGVGGRGAVFCAGLKPQPLCQGAEKGLGFPGQRHLGTGLQ